VKLNDLEIGTKWVGEYAQWHSDKTAKTRFRRFWHYLPGAYQDFWTEFFSVLPDEAAFIEG
jgi:hypothetical protein